LTHRLKSPSSCGLSTIPWLLVSLFDGFGCVGFGLTVYGSDCIGSKKIDPRPSLVQIWFVGRPRYSYQWIDKKLARLRLFCMPHACIG